MVCLPIHVPYDLEQSDFEVMIFFMFCVVVSKSYDHLCQKLVANSDRQR